MPSEQQTSADDELKFSYYNSLTTWIDIDRLLTEFGLSRGDIMESTESIPRAINAFSRRLPTYVTIKDVKKRWGRGQVSLPFHVCITIF